MSWEYSKLQSGFTSQVRDINLYKDEKCYTHHKQLFSPRDMVRCWDECLEKSDYHQRHMYIQQFNAHNHWKKRGLSIVPLKFGIGFSKGFYNQVGWKLLLYFSKVGCNSFFIWYKEHFQEQLQVYLMFYLPNRFHPLYVQGAALVNIFKDGSVLVSHGGTEMGQGINTKAIQVRLANNRKSYILENWCTMKTTYEFISSLLQIASRILKVPMSTIHIKETCTGNVPNAAPSAASFGTDAVGMAVKVKHYVDY